MLPIAGLRHGIEEARLVRLKAIIGDYAGMRITS
jgi:hypothetical protein